MNATQRKYLEGRLSKIVQDKKREVDSKYPLPIITFEAKVTAISNGTAKLKSLDKLSRYTDLIEAYTFEFDTDVEKVQALRNALKSKIDKESQNILDSMYLSESPDVKDMLVALETLSI